MKEYILKYTFYNVDREIRCTSLLEFSIQLESVMSNPRILDNSITFYTEDK